MMNKKREKTEKVHLHLTLPEAMVERIRDEASDRGQPVCIYVERVMNYYFEHAKREDPKDSEREAI